MTQRPVGPPSSGAVVERPGVEQFAAAGLYEPGAPNAAERLELLEWLAELGCTVEEMVAGQSEGQLTSVAADRALLPGSPLSLDEVAAAAGLDRPTLERVLRASGFVPQRARLTDADVPLFRLFAAALTLFTERQALHFTRVMGSSLARIAEAANSMFLIDVEGPMRSAASSELDLARQQLAGTQLLDGVAEGVASLFRLHADDAVRRSRVARRNTGSLEVVPMAVGFVDLVGYTVLAERSSASELLSLLVEFEGRAFDLVTEMGGRVVKLIGDEVMFTAVGAADGAAIALALVDSLRDRDDVAPRGGVAYGDVLGQGGDCYGSVVNLASRIADIAVPWEVLVTEAVADAADGRFVTAPAGRRMLKGFDAPIPLRSIHPVG